MLRRLFKGRDRLADPDPAVRRDAVLQLDAGDPEQAATLARLLQEDADAGVRRACLDRISDPEPLLRLLDDAQWAERAARRLLALLPRDDARRRHPLLAELELLEAAPDTAAAGIAALDDPRQLADLALRADQALRERLLAHPRLSDPAGLALLERRSRGHDKRLNRYARERLDLLKSTQREAAETRARADELAGALARNDPGGQNPTALHQRRQALAAELAGVLGRHDDLRRQLAQFAVDESSLTHLREQLQRLSEELARERPEAGAQAPVEPDAGASVDPAAQAESTSAGQAMGPSAGALGEPGSDAFAVLVEACAGLERELADATALQPEVFAELAGRQRRLAEAWFEASTGQRPDSEQLQAFESCGQRLRELAGALDRLAGQTLPEALPPLPDALPAAADQAEPFWSLVAAARTRLRALKSLRRELGWPQWAHPAPALPALQTQIAGLEAAMARIDEQVRDREQQVAGLLDALDASISAGALQESRQQLAEVRRLHDTLPERTARSLGRRMASAGARVAELRDWQSFATSPKREALRDALRQLAESPLSPPDQADRIKALRREWQSLGLAVTAAERRLESEFNELAERAFQPCREYFAAQADERARNLAERQRVCVQLEEYLQSTDWRHADMRAAEQIMRAARDEWRRLQPVDRGKARALDERFEQLQQQLYDRVKAAWDRNTAAKQAIVDAARALLEGDEEPARRAAAAKDLQQRWREVGNVPRRTDQELWREFRALCDQIFAGRDAARQASDAAVDAEHARCSEALAQLEALLASRDLHSVSAAELRSRREALDAIDALPQRLAGPLRQRRADLLARYQALLDEQKQAARRRQLSELLETDAAFSAAELAYRAGDSARPEIPLPVFAGRLDCSDEVPLDALQRLTIEAELAAGLDSPETDQALRRELQVARLQASLSGSKRRPDARELAEAWCALGPKDASLSGLRERLLAALARLHEAG
ncbi:MAG: DUF349 domain-containing protein [Pseudomonadales bacterium]